jgi:hypothetical protein
VRFIFGDGPMLDASGHKQELAFLQPYVMVAKLHAKASLDDEEQLVF